MLCQSSQFKSERSEEVCKIMAVLEGGCESVICVFAKRDNVCSEYIFKTCCKRCAEIKTVL